MSLFQTFKKMQSRGVMIGIGIFTLITFSITSAVTGALARDPREDSALHVTLPVGGRVKLKAEDRDRAAYVAQVFFDTTLFQQCQRAGLRKMLMPVFQLLSVGSLLQNDQETRKKKGDLVSQVLLIGALARDRGIAATQSDVVRWLGEAFESTEEYKRLCSVLGTRPESFELALREALLIKRFVVLVSKQAPLPSGEEIVAEWAVRAEKFTFESIAFSAEGKKSKIDAAAITNEELQTYLDGRSEFQNTQYREAEKVVLEGLAVLNPQDKQSDGFEALITAEQVQESDATNYFNIARSARFAGKKPNPGFVPGTESAPATQPAEIQIEFADVKDRATREVKVARAIEKVLEEARKEITAPGFDLKKTGEKYGLTYWSSGEPKDLAGIRTLPIYGGQALVTPLSDIKEGEFYAGYQPVEGAIEITRVTKRIAARIPPASEIRERVLPEFIDIKAWDSAKDDAREFQAALRDATGDDKFSRLAKEKSLEIKQLSPVKRSLSYDSPEFQMLDPKSPERQLLQQHSMARGNEKADPLELKVGEISAPTIDEANKVCYIVRCAARVKPTMAEMGSGDYMGSRESIIGELRRRKTSESLDPETLSTWLKVERPKASREDDETAESAPSKPQ